MTRTEYISRRNKNIPAAAMHADRVAPDAVVCSRPSDKVAGVWNAAFHRELERCSPTGPIPSQKFVAQAVRYANRTVPAMVRRVPNPQTGGNVVPSPYTVSAWEFAFNGFLEQLCADAGVEV